MTITKAREVLGKRAETMTDNEITQVIHFLEKLANIVIDSVTEKRE